MDYAFHPVQKISPVFVLGTGNYQALLGTRVSCIVTERSKSMAYILQRNHVQNLSRICFMYDLSWLMLEMVENFCSQI